MESSNAVPTEALIGGGIKNISLFQSFCHSLKNVKTNGQALSYKKTTLRLTYILYKHVYTIITRSSVFSGVPIRQILMLSSQRGSGLKEIQQRKVLRKHVQMPSKSGLNGGISCHRTSFVHG